LNKLTEVSVKNGYKATYNHYRKLVYPLFLILLLLLLTSSAQAKYSGGTGEPNNPYRIADANDMNEIGTHIEDWNDCFVLVNDINLAEFTGTQFNIIGNDVNAFSGVFDGNNHTIYNFSYESTGTNCIGLFGSAIGNNTLIKDLTLRDPNVDAGTGAGIGSLVGYLGGGSITGCGAEVSTVSGEMIVGGLLGANFDGMVENCYVTGIVSGNSDFVGGLVGWNYLGTVENCHATCTVIAEFLGGAGGLAGLNTSTIKNCYSDGEITGKQVVGGLVGQNGTNDDGGIGRLENCYSTANVTATTMLAGGLMGINDAIVKNCYAAGNIDGNTLTGGLAGVNYGGTIENCYAIGSVEGNSEVGGLVGKTRESTIKYCYAVGEVLGDVNTGGLVGSTYDINNDFYTKCFWDSDINPDVNGIGNISDSNVIGESTTNMQTKSTFTDASWDFVGEVINGPNDIWRMCVDDVNYPLLSWQFNDVDFTCPDGVDFIDFSILASSWLSTAGEIGWNPVCDISDPNDDVIDELDLAVFCENWLAGVE